MSSRVPRLDDVKCFLLVHFEESFCQLSEILVLHKVEDRFYIMLLRLLRGRYALEYVIRNLSAPIAGWHIILIGME